MLRLAQPCGSGAYDSMRQHGGWWLGLLVGQQPIEAQQERTRHRMPEASEFAGLAL